MSERLSDRCKGRWPNLLPILGLDRRFLSGKHCPCPACGGTDRFRFDDKDGRGTWICSHCGAGDGVSLAMLVNGWDFKTAAERIEAVVGKAEALPQRRERDEKALRDAMNRLWSEARPIVYGDGAWRYLRARGIELERYPAALRFIERCRYRDDAGTGASHYPALLAKVTGPDGRPSTIHRTYLSDDCSRKAPVADARRLMPGKTAKGCAIRLAEPGPVLGIAEGIETALSASIMWRMPCWAAVSAGMLMAWEPPPEVNEVVVFADNDRAFAGQSAAYALAHRLASRSLRVRVEMPPDPDTDWNDALMADAMAGAAA